MANEEGAIQKLILQWLEVQKYYVWRNYVGAVIHGNPKKGTMGFSKNPAKGMPDIMGIMKNCPGRLFAIEVKTPTGKVAPHQKERLNALTERGALAFIARSLDTVITTLKEHDRV